LDADGAAMAGDACDVIGVVVDVAGAFTVNWVPVTTVTSAPSATWLGS
jgi:hypothetical protein